MMTCTWWVRLRAHARWRRFWENEDGCISLPVALAIGAVASGATAVYQTKSASGINRRSIDAQRQSESQALQLDQQRHKDNLKLTREQDLARAERYNAWITSEDKRWDDYMRMQSPRWATGNQAYGQVAGLLGVGGGGGGGAMPPPGGGASAGASPQGTMGAMASLGQSGARPGMRGRDAFARLAPQQRMAYGQPGSASMSQNNMMRLIQLAQQYGGPQTPMPSNYVGNQPYR